MAVDGEPAIPSSSLSVPDTNPELTPPTSSISSGQSMDVDHSLDLSASSPVLTASPLTNAGGQSSSLHGHHVRILEGRFAGSEGVVTQGSTGLYIVSLPDGTKVSKREPQLQLISADSQTDIHQLQLPPVETSPRMSYANSTTLPPPSVVHRHPMVSAAFVQPSITPAHVISSMPSSFSSSVSSGSSVTSAPRKRTSSKIHWLPGQHVRIVVGKHSGEVGTVVSSGHGFICVDVCGDQLQKRACELELGTNGPRKKIKATVQPKVEMDPSSFDNEVCAAAFLLLDLRVPAPGSQGSPSPPLPSTPLRAPDTPAPALANAVATMSSSASLHSSAPPSWGMNMMQNSPSSYPFSYHHAIPAQAMPAHAVPAPPLPAAQAVPAHALPATYSSAQRVMSSYHPQSQYSNWYSYPPSAGAS